MAKSIEACLKEFLSELNEDSDTNYRGSKNHESVNSLLAKAVKAFKARVKSSRFPMYFFMGSAYSPSDGSTTYIGAAATTVSNEDTQKLVVPVSGRIKSFRVKVGVTGTLGTTETVSHYLRVAGQDVGPLEFNYSAAHSTGEISLDHAVTAGDTIVVKVVHPTWATNPTALRFWACAIIE